MGMNTPSPEILQQLMAQGQMQGTDPSQGQIDELQAQQAATGGHPMAGIVSPPDIQAPSIDPMDMLSEVITGYMGYATRILQDEQLDKPVQSKILLEQAQAISSLVSLIGQNQADPAAQQAQLAEMAMKQQQHEQDLQMKHEAHQAMIGQQQEKHQVEVQKMAHDMMMNQQKMEHDKQLHEQKLVHNEKEHEHKLTQAKQAAQSKQSSKQGNDKGKK